MKRLLDIILSSLALLVLFIPGLAIMLILKCTGEHEVWFFQPRVGLDGKHFQVFKFATMRKDSEFTGTKDITLRNDPRVLPVGRILRKGKINELPQLINILKGDMSIVGWRPLLPKSFLYYPKHIQEQIIHAKPGLTGIGSIIFRDEEAITANSNKAPELVYREDIAPYKGELELWYQRHQNFQLDLKIILVTAYIVIHPGSERYLNWFPSIPTRPAGLEDLSFAPTPTPGNPAPGRT